jgi:hypothetical protein
MCKNYLKNINHTNNGIIDTIDATTDIPVARTHFG